MFLLGRVACQVPLFAKQGLLPMERGASDSEFIVPGVGEVARGDVWEYFIKGEPMQSDEMIACLQDLTESSATATYLVNSVEALEPEVFHGFKDPIPFTGEVPSGMDHYAIQLFLQSIIYTPASEFSSSLFAV